MSSAHLGALALAVVSLAACRSSPPPDPPFESPTFTGAISQIDGDRILVVHTEDECGRTYFSRKAKTVVLQKTQAGTLEPSSWNALATNQVVEVWQGGVMLLSCPGRTSAEKVVVQPLGPDGEIDRPVREFAGAMPGEHVVIYVLDGQHGRVFGRLEGSCPDGKPETRWTIPENGADAEVSVKGRGIAREQQVLPGEELRGGTRPDAETWTVTVGVEPEDYHLEAVLTATGGDACFFDLTGRLTGTSRF